MSSNSNNTFTKLPVTVLSGFLGSGKTTLLQHILKNKQGLRCAILVNDMAEVNVDANIAAKIIQKEEKLVQMQNGCICCTLREDLLEEVANLAKENAFDYLVIESTGISEPMQVAETFTFDNEELDLQSLSELATLDTCVTVVDASHFMHNWESAETVSQREQRRYLEGGMDGEEPEVDEQDERNIVDLLVDQVEFANVILMNKCDLVQEEQLGQLEAIIGSLNPKAKVIRTKYSEVDLNEVINTGLFSFEDAAESPKWLQELRGTHVPETLEYGIGSFIYRNRDRPFHPKRFYEFIDEIFMCTYEPLFLPKMDEMDVETKEEESSNDKEEGEEEEEGEENEELDAVEHYAKLEELKKKTSDRRNELYGHMLRSKGTCWLADLHDFGIHFAHSGNILQLTPEGQWFAASDPEDWDEEMMDEPLKKALAESPFGDRLQEIVFIGIDLKEEVLTKALDNCLLTDEEMEGGPENWPVGETPWKWIEYVDESELQPEEGHEGHNHN